MHARSYLWFSYTKHKQVWLKTTPEVHPISLPPLFLTAATGDAAWSSLGTTEGSSLSCSQDPDWLCRRGLQDGQCEDKFKSIKKRMFSNAVKAGIKTTTQHIIMVRVYWECRPYLCMCACVHACKNVGGGNGEIPWESTSLGFWYSRKIQLKLQGCLTT